MYFTKFFNDLINLNTWKGIKNLISRFSNIALDIQFSIKYSAKEFHEFLPPLSIKSFSLSPTDKNEIISIVSALDSQKASGPNSIPIKILKLMKNDISDQLAVLFNFSFTSGSFATIFF